MILSVSVFRGGITSQTTQKPFLSSFRNQSYLLKEDWFSPRRCGDGGPWELLSSPNSLSRWRRRFWFWLLVSVSPLTIVLSISHRHSAFHAAGQDFQFFRFVTSQIMTEKIMERNRKCLQGWDKKWTRMQIYRNLGTSFLPAMYFETLDHSEEHRDTEHKTRAQTI